MEDTPSSNYMKLLLKRRLITIWQKFPNEIKILAHLPIFKTLIEEKPLVYSKADRKKKNYTSNFVIGTKMC